MLIRIGSKTAISDVEEEKTWSLQNIERTSEILGVHHFLLLRFLDQIFTSKLSEDLRQK